MTYENYLLEAIRRKQLSEDDLRFVIHSYSSNITRAKNYYFLKKIHNILKNETLHHSHAIIQHFEITFTQERPCPINIRTAEQGQKTN